MTWTATIVLALLAYASGFFTAYCLRGGDH